MHCEPTDCSLFIIVYSKNRKLVVSTLTSLRASPFIFQFSIFNFWFLSVVKGQLYSFPSSIMNAAQYLGFSNPAVFLTLFCAARKASRFDIPLVRLV